MGKHSEWRKVAKKVRRSSIRQKLAKERCGKEQEAQRLREQSPSYQLWLKEQEDAENFQEEEEQRISEEGNRIWMENEKEAQRQWQLLQDKLAQAREERAKQNERIRQEWEQEQKKLQELKEKRKKLEEEREKQAQLLKQRIDEFVQNGGTVPEELKAPLETNPGKPLCPFFQKTGACRFRDACSRNHARPGVSRILLVHRFYTHFSLRNSTEHEYGNDMSLEFEDVETYGHFEDFFYDVLPELEKFGTVRQFKVCCNQEAHLRGNVYIEFSRVQEAVKAYQNLQGRWYGGKQLNVEFCNVDSWKAAICGLFFKRSCPKGSACNFLHVFRNPMRMFMQADKDLHRTPPSRAEITDEEIAHENGKNSSRSWRWSESPERISTKHLKTSKNGNRKSRSKSRDSDYRHRRDRKESNSRKRSRSRSRSRSSSNNSKSKYSQSRSSLHRKSIKRRRRSRS